MRALIIACCLVCGLLLAAACSSTPLFAAFAAASTEKSVMDGRWRLIADDLAKAVFEGLGSQSGEQFRAFSIQTADESALGKALASYLVTDFVHRGYLPASAPNASTVSLRWSVRLIRHVSVDGRAGRDQADESGPGTPLGLGVSRLSRSEPEGAEDALTAVLAKVGSAPAGTEVVVRLAADVAGKPCLRRVQSYFVSDAELPGHADAASRMQALASTKSSK